MRDVLGPGTVLGYCTNVHAGATWEQTKQSLDQHALQVKLSISPNEPMGIGLWLSAHAARQIITQVRIKELRNWLAERRLFVFTMNGFPYGEFHQPIVKHAVYQPHWGEPERKAYTLELIEIFAALLPEHEGTISTLPLGWPTEFHKTSDPSRAVSRLHQIAQELAELARQTNKLIHIDLEPEPGCMLDSADDVLEFFERELPEPVHREHIGICHDICHAAVMFEDQTEVLRRYAEAGIRVNKVQISNASRVPCDEHQSEAIKTLRRFIEPRYLHQTMIKGDQDQRFFDDLPKAFDALDSDTRGRRLLEGEWRTHFHLPVYLETIGPLQTTQDEILPAIRAARRYHDTRFFEVETYAWNVLPEELKAPTLAEGIARELQWVIDQFADDNSA